jgi:hypothetical protein
MYTILEKINHSITMVEIKTAAKCSMSPIVP